MADEKTVVVDETQDDADFASGFSPTEAAPLTAAPAVVEPEPKVEEAVVVAPVEPPPPEPEYVKITKAQFDALEAAAAKVGDFDKKFDKAFGTVGGLQDIVKQLQNSTPKGEAVHLTDEMFAEMAEDYPDLAKHQRNILEKVLKGAVGTGTNVPTVDPATVHNLIAEGVKQAQIEALEDEYPDWKVIVGAVPSADKANPNNPFRAWLAKQPAHYAEKVTSTHNAAVLAKAITKFKEATKAPPPSSKDAQTPKQDARRAIVKAAIPLKGDGSPPAPTKTDDDEFELGFRTG